MDQSDGFQSFLKRKGTLSRWTAFCFYITLLLGTTWVQAEEPTHNYFTASDDVNIHYMLLGDSGSYVVLIHGYTGSAEGNWFRNGIAEALSTNHRVVAIDCRNHGLSDKPTPHGFGIPSDVLELMDHLKIKKAHIHGYSMGGAITGQLLASNPERFITAAFGGSGIRESDLSWAAKMPADEEGRDPEESEVSRALRIRSAMDNGMTHAQAEKAAKSPRRPMMDSATSSQLTALRRRWALQIDLTKITIPVLAINGEYDRPISKTHRMSRELPNFTNVVLPGKSHLTAIVGGYMPDQYRDSLVDFINLNDLE